MLQATPGTSAKRVGGAMRNRLSTLSTDEIYKRFDLCLGLQDAHKCIYLPSSMEKNQYLPSYLSQNVIFIVSNYSHIHTGSFIFFN